MRIVHIAAGAGGMHCGACARDIALVRALLARGHDVQVLPLYTPLRHDSPGPLPATGLFFSGINVYLQQAYDFFQRSPACLDALLSHPLLLELVAKFAISVDPVHLGPLTVSMLAGENGRQRKELHKLLAFLERGERPEIVVLTNSLLSGIAPALKARLRVPVVCLLQGEETFVNGLPAPYQAEAMRCLRENAAAIDGFMAPHATYASEMAAFLGVSPARVRVLHAAIDPLPYHHAAPRPRDPFVIGYLSVITPGKGLDLLVEAFARLASQGHESVRLHVAGKVMDKRYWETLLNRLAIEKLTARFHYFGEVDFAEKVAFFHQCSAFALPSRFDEARGMAMLEAQSAGVPVVAPAAGVYPEMLGLTGGGVLIPPGDPAALAHALAQLLAAPDAADAMGAAGVEGVARHYAAARAAVQAGELYREVVDGLLPAQA